MKARKARLDADRRAISLTRLVAHVGEGACVRSVQPDALECIATGERTSLVDDGPTDLERFTNQLGWTLVRQQQVLADFSVRLVAEGPIDAMRWNGEAAIRAELVLLGTWRLLSYLVNAVVSAEAQALHLTGMAEQIANSLLGSPGFPTGEGPWKHNSTSPIDNLTSLIKCDVDRAMRFIYLEAADALRGVRS